MAELPFYTSPSLLRSALKRLQTDRKTNKVTSKRQILTLVERKQVLDKTDGRCHVCGVKIQGSFQADHVKSHSSGGYHNVSNYLPSCNLCNNYRWHYSPQEIQWILKLGVWVK